MTHHSSPRWVVLASLLIAGCGPGSSASGPGTLADPERAKTTLITALDAWKRGDDHAALANASDPIRVADEDWMTGAKLTEYGPPTLGQPLGTGQVFQVPLTVRTKEGRTVKKDTRYAVTFDKSGGFVLRQD